MGAATLERSATLEKVRVALRAEDPLSQAGMSAELASCPELEVLSETDEAADVVVLVVQVMDEAAGQQIRRLRRNGTGAVVLVVADVNDQGLFAAVEAGVAGLVRRNEATTERLRTVIRDARAGNGNIPSDLLGRLMRQVNHLHDRVLEPQGMHVNGLSDRELDVLRLVAEGCPTSEIAQELAYSERTIKNIIQAVTTRLNLRNRSHAVAYALRQGLI